MSTARVVRSVPSEILATCINVGNILNELEPSPAPDSADKQADFDLLPDIPSFITSIHSGCAQPAPAAELAIWMAITRSIAWIGCRRRPLIERTSVTSAGRLSESTIDPAKMRHDLVLPVDICRMAD
jgi:hypothetical protein